MHFHKFLFLLFFIASTASAQIDISKAKGVDISAYKTFAVQKGQVVSLIKDKKINEARIFAVVQEAVTREMTLRGYEATVDSTAQLFITYVYEESDKSNFQKSGPLGKTPVDNPIDFDGRLSRDVIETRMLIIDIERNKSSIWTANCFLDGTQKDLNKLFDLTITSAFKKFPIQGKKKR